MKVWSIKEQATGRWSVSCTGGCKRPLNTAVEDEKHAVNLVNYHLRGYHPTAEPAQMRAETSPPNIPGLPTSLNLTEVARYVVDLDSTEEWLVWQALVGIEPLSMAILLARNIAAAEEPTFVYTAPF